VRNDIADSGLSRNAHFTGSAAAGALVLLIRACALVLFTVMSLAEPFLAVVLIALALGCFFVAVVFGFIFHAPFHHRLARSARVHSVDQDSASSGAIKRKFGAPFAACRYGYTRGKGMFLGRLSLSITVSLDRP
jgi:predicted membrane protein